MILGGLILAVVAQVAPAPAPAPVPAPLPAQAPAVPAAPVPEAMPTEVWPPGSLWAEVMAAPMEWEVRRFPSRQATTKARQVNVAARCNLNEERWAWPESFHPRFDAAVSDIQAAYWVWDKLDDCQATWRQWWEVRLELAKLKRMLGDEDFAAGRMPPAIPSRWFRELK